MSMQILQSQPGDNVEMHDGVKGVVVINFDLGLCGHGYEVHGWGWDEGGLLIDGSSEGLLRYTKDVLLFNQSFYEHN